MQVWRALVTLFLLGTATLFSGLIANAAFAVATPVDTGEDSEAKVGNPKPVSQVAGTEYVVFDPRFSFAATRHVGETRVGSVGTFKEFDPDPTVAAFSHDCPTTGDHTPCALRFEYNFLDASDFLGISFSFGRAGISTVNLDGTPGDDLALPTDSTFNLNDLMHNLLDDGISVESLELELCADDQGQPLQLEVKFEDQEVQNESSMLKVITLSATGCTTFDLLLSDFAETANFLRNAVKLVTITVVRASNLQALDGGFTVKSVKLKDLDGPNFEAVHLATLSDDQLVAEIARRDFESLLRLVDAKTGASLDRTLFRDLIHWGATGWLLASLPAAVEQGWIASEDARQRGEQILSFVDNDAIWGNEPACKLGNSQGLMYHFGGIDPIELFGPCTGTRKIDVGDVNAVEASTIDTALFQFGAATFAAGFPDNNDPNNPNHQIQVHTNNILNRTLWEDLVDSDTGQFYLGWKPQADTTPPGRFTVNVVPGDDTQGFWASREVAPGQCPTAGQGEALTLDFWTDEGALAAVLAAGSPAHPVDPTPWYSMARTLGSGACAGLVQTFPGAWFTYTFFTATYLPPSQGVDRSSEWGWKVPPDGAGNVDWTQNAIGVFDALQSQSPGEIPDAAEHPDTSYHAQGRAGCAKLADPPLLGTITPYSLQLATGLGGSTATTAIAELRSILQQRPEVWDPMFGFLDSYHPDLSEFKTSFEAQFQQSPALLREDGLWVQQQVWPLDKGAALLAQLNFLDPSKDSNDGIGIVREIANQHPVIASGITRVFNSGCTPPNSGDWTVVQSCPFEEISDSAPGNVIIQKSANDVVDEEESIVTLTIAENASLNINFASQHLRVREDSRVLIKDGAKID